MQWNLVLTGLRVFNEYARLSVCNLSGACPVLQRASHFQQICEALLARQFRSRESRIQRIHKALDLNGDVLVLKLGLILFVCFNGLVLKNYYLIDLYMRKNIQVSKQARLAISFANSKKIKKWRWYATQKTKNRYYYIIQ